MTLPNTASDTIVTLAATQALTAKTLTTPIINGAVTGTITPPLTFYGANFNVSDGFLINGKIVPSVATDDLTAAIKGMDGEDPSATNPVYVRIGNTIRSITAALSVTKADATNWFNAGSTELATKEIDYFVYIGYNATDGVVVGFSRIPYAALYSDFSATTTDKKYCAISTITNAAAGDNYTIIGRFAATLSAGAGYTWTVPTFTTKNLIQRPIFETRWLEWLPTYTAATGTWTSVATTLKYYRIQYNTVYIRGGFQGTTNNDTASLKITFPFLPLYSGNENEGMCAQARNGAGWLLPNYALFQTTVFSVGYSFTIGTSRGFIVQGMYEI